VILHTEAGRIIVVGGVTSLRNHETAVDVWLDVMVRQTDRLESVVASVERVHVQDVGRVALEEWKIIREVLWFDLEIVGSMTDVPVGTIGIH